MKLRRLYCNNSELFGPLVFKDGLNIVVAEIRIPENRDLQTHNLGKSTLAEVLDFCLLRRKDKKFFLFAHPEIFSGLSFFLELELDGGCYLTIGRPVDPGSQVSFVRSATPIEDASTLTPDEWDHFGLPFERSKVLLDSYLGIQSIKPWGFRKLSGYLFRRQRDYLDVFQLSKFSGPHADWKPFVAHLLGLTSGAVGSLYAKREDLEKLDVRVAELSREWGKNLPDISVLDGLIASKQAEIEERREVLDSFNFNDEDSRASVRVVDEVENEISSLNEERYHLQQLTRRIEESLKEGRILFRIKDAEDLFREAGIALEGQITRTYEQLIAFNREITVEREGYLQAQKSEAHQRIEDINTLLAALNVERAKSLEYLRESESLAKYRATSSELTRLDSDLAKLESQRETVARLAELKRDQRALQEELGRSINEVQVEIQAQSEDTSSYFGQLRKFFGDIIHEVLGQRAIIAIKQNDAGGVEFSPEFVGESGLATDDGKGTTYRKLMCMAFDLALLRVNRDVPFPRFVYHDGALEQMEARTQMKFLGVLRAYADLGLQPICSALDGDLSFMTRESWAGDVVLTLHDEGMAGRLFRTDKW